MVDVETITAIASINPIELKIERPFLLDRFLETRVMARNYGPSLELCLYFAGISYTT